MILRSPTLPRGTGTPSIGTHELYVVFIQRKLDAIEMSALRTLGRHRRLEDEEGAVGIFEAFDSCLCSFLPFLRSGTL